MLPIVLGQFSSDFDIRSRHLVYGVTIVFIDDPKNAIGDYSDLDFEDPEQPAGINSKPNVQVETFLI